MKQFFIYAPLVLNVFTLQTSVMAFAFKEKHLYHFNNEPIDVVIPAIEKDRETLDLCIDGIKSNGERIRNVYVVSPYQLTEKAKWIDEKIYPFSFYDIAYAIYNDGIRAKNYLSNPGNRIGWIYQQLLKLYSPFVIEGISSNILLLDADTIFLRPVSFLNEQSEPYFNTGAEYHVPYFVHAQKLIPGFEKIIPEYSGICHHMLIQKSILTRLFDVIALHNQMEPWKALCKHVEILPTDEITGSGISEYEIYFNFIFATSHQAHIRNLKWENVWSLEDIQQYKAAGLHYISCHAYMREEAKKREIL